MALFIIKDICGVIFEKVDYDQWKKFALINTTCHNVVNNKLNNIKNNIPYNVLMDIYTINSDCELRIIQCDMCSKVKSYYNPDDYEHCNCDKDICGDCIAERDCGCYACLKYVCPKCQKSHCCKCSSDKCEECGLPICFDCDEYEWGITIHTKCIKKN
jgi:hypothetical protein